MKAIAVWQAALSDPHKKMPQYLKTHKLSMRLDGHQHNWGISGSPGHQYEKMDAGDLLGWNMMEWVEGSTNKTMRSDHQVIRSGQWVWFTNKGHGQVGTTHTLPGATFRAFMNRVGWTSLQSVEKMFRQNIFTTAYDNCYSIDLTKDNYKTAWCRKKVLLVELWLINLLVDTDSTWPKIINSQAQLRQDNHLTPSESLTATSTSRIAQQNSGVHCGDLSQKARIIGLPATRTLEVWEPNNETLHEGGQMPFLLKRPGSWTRNLDSYHKYIPSPLFDDSERKFNFLLFCAFVFFFLVVDLFILCHVSLLLLLSGTCLWFMHLVTELTRSNSAPSASQIPPPRRPQAICAGPMPMPSITSWLWI